MIKTTRNAGEWIITGIKDDSLGKSEKNDLVIWDETNMINLIIKSKKAELGVWVNKKELLQVLKEVEK